MFITICDKTGIQFEAESKRQKNHPRVSALLNEAAKVESERMAQAWQDARAEAIAGMTVVEAFDYAGFEMRYEYNRSSHYLTMFDRVYAGTINSAPCVVIYSYTGGHDYSEYCAYYCADPVAAELTPLAPSEGIGKTLQDFFGN